MPTTTTSNSRSNSPLMRHPADSTSTFMHQHKQQLNSSKMPTKITWAVVSVVIVATTTTITPLGGGGGVSAFSPLSSSSAFHRNILEPQKPQQWSSLPQSSVYSSSCSSYTTPTTALHAEKKKDRSSSPFAVKNALLSGCLGLAVWTSSMVGGGSGGNFLVPPIASASNPADIVGCLFQKCPIPLAKCIADPRCLANVVCINTCNDRPDETACQIQCGDLVGESAAIAQFNQCVVSDMSCVPQKADEGFYPVPRPDQVVPKFDASFFNGKLYITAGQNPLFDTFDCQVHFFTNTEPGKFFAKLNWRITEPDGEYFTRDALQEFVQDPKDPSHLINHDNEFLHYQDDWYIIDYEYDNNPSKIPPFAFVYYRGSNDAWDGYGGVVVYTRDASLPLELLPRLREAARKINYDFDKDFVITDNSCPRELSSGEKVVLREKFAGKLVLQTEEQLQAAATRLRGNAVNSVKAQKLFFEDRSSSADLASKTLEQSVTDFEKE